MPNQVYKKKLGLEIKNFYSLEYGQKFYSVPVIIDDCKWRLLAFPDGDQTEEYLSLYLEAYDFELFPHGWKRYVKLRFTVVNQLCEELSVHKETKQWFDQSAPIWGFQEMLSHSKLYVDGFLVNSTVKIVAEVEFIGTSDESEEKYEPLSRVEENDSVEFLDVVIKTQEVIDIHGFQVHPSQVESVRRIFQRHPDIAVGFRAKNQHLRTTFMNFLLGIIETMCLSPQELSTEDTALAYLKDAGFKVDWLENKLDLVIEKKRKEKLGLTKVQDIEKELHDLILKYEKKTLKFLSTRAPLKFDDVV